MDRTNSYCVVSYFIHRVCSLNHNILFLADQTASDMKEKTVEEVLEEIRKIREKNKEIYREMGEIG